MEEWLCYFKQCSIGSYNTFASVFHQLTDEQLVSLKNKMEKFYERQASPSLFVTAVILSQQLFQLRSGNPEFKTNDFIDAV